MSKDLYLLTAISHLMRLGITNEHIIGQPLPVYIPGDGMVLRFISQGNWRNAIQSIRHCPLPIGRNSISWLPGSSIDMPSCTLRSEYYETANYREE